MYVRVGARVVEMKKGKAINAQVIEDNTRKWVYRIQCASENEKSRPVCGSSREKSIAQSAVVRKVTRAFKTKVRHVTGQLNVPNKTRDEPQVLIPTHFPQMELGKN